MARTILLTLAGLVVLYAVDVFLARLEQSEERVEAQRFYRDGQRLTGQARYEDAMEQFRAALALNRDNPEYQLTFADSLVRANRSAEAKDALNDLLQRDADSGPANLRMARLLESQGDHAEAISFYHRAIYGKWAGHPQDSAKQRLEARLELIDLLANQHASSDLLAELLPVQGLAEGDRSINLKLGRLFIQAGSPQRGSAVFRSILKNDPQNFDALTGLGEAELASGNFRVALANFDAALRIKPDEEPVRQRLRVVRDATSLDPTQSGLSREESFARSRTLLNLVLRDLTRCSALSEETRAQMQEARDLGKQPASVSQRAAAFEKAIALTEQLSQAQSTECAGVSSDPAIAAVVNRLKR